MKITGLTTQRYSESHDLADFGHATEVFTLSITTDEGLTGMGVLSLLVSPTGGVGPIYEAVIHDFLANLLVGEEASATERLWRRMYEATIRWGRRGLAVHCISLVDLALWDIKAKQAGVPLWELLGGPVRDVIPTYVNTALHLPPKELAERAARYVERGFDALKIRGSATVVSTDEATRRVREVRAAVGPDVKLMVDVNGTWDPVTAIRMLRAWEPYDIFWLEEPVPPDDVHGYVRVRDVAKSMGVLIAGGEQLSTVHDFRLLMERDAVDVIQPNCTLAGGVTEFLRIGHLAESHAVRISPHTLQHVHNQLAAAVPAVMWLEVFMPDNPLRSFFLRLFKEPRQAREAVDGVLELPRAPGFGLELDEELAEATRVG